MLKVLLITYVSFLSLVCPAQPKLPDWSGPAEMEVEDPAKTVAELTTAVSDKGRIVVSWKVGGTLPNFFAVERSDNGKPFDVVGVINNVPVGRTTFQWTDDAPKRGRNLYRLRYSFPHADSLYSKISSAVLDGAPTYRFYPNPVDHVLIIRSEHPVDVQITDANGKLRLSQPRVQGLQTVNVSSLEKGVYLIRFTNKLTAVMSQEKLVKN